MFDRKHYYTYVVSTILEKGIFEIEEEKLNQLKEYYVKHFIANKECNYKIGENMKLFLFENVNMTDLNKEQLKRFITLPQKREIISAIIDTDDNNFINYYLSNINDISSTDYDEIYEMFSDYYSNNVLIKRTKKNLSKLANTQEQKDIFDKRKNKNLVVN